MAQTMKNVMKKMETFSQVWKSATKGSMRVVYRDVLTSHFETFIDNKLYKCDMLYIELDNVGKIVLKVSDELN